MKKYMFIPALLFLGVLIWVEQLFLGADSQSGLASGHMKYISVEFWQVGCATGFVLLASVMSVYYKLKLEQDLLVGAARSFVQLIAVGYLLKIVFGLNAAWPVMLMYLGTTVFATQIISGRVKDRGIAYTLPVFVSMFLTSFLVTTIVSGAIIQARPWWEPQYFIPVGGMLAGNTMNSLSVCLDRYFSDLRLRRAEVEMRLCLGATSWEAGQDVFRAAMRAGMIPAINSMMGVGLVSLPGMMTGQIIAGADPSDAVRYQVIISMMLTASTSLAAFFVLNLVRRRCFGRADNLLLPR